MTRKLNILFYSYQHLNFNSGGLQDQINYTKSTLESIGHKVYFLEDWFRLKPEIDICHQFSLHFTLTNTFAELKSRDFPIVISTVFNERQFIYNRLARLLSKYGIPVLYHKNTKHFLSNAEYLISLGEWESKLLKRSYSFKTKIDTIPNGICDEIIKYNNPNLILKKKYVVCVGNICERKNQLELIRVCNRLKYELVLIGPESDTDQEYVEQCKYEAGENVRFMGFIDNRSEEFINLISEAQVFALVSKNEVLPISVFEALALGTAVCCTINCSISSYLNESKGVELCNPLSFNDIMTKIEKQMDFQFSEEVSLEIRNVYNWLNVAKKVESVYYKVLNNR